MALFMNNQHDSRSELQRRLAAELAEKAKKKAALENAERPDGVNDSAFVKNTKSTSPLAWVWILIVITAIGAAIFIAVNPS